MIRGAILFKRRIRFICVVVVMLFVMCMSVSAMETGKPQTATIHGILKINIPLEKDTERSRIFARKVTFGTVPIILMVSALLRKKFRTRDYNSPLVAARLNPYEVAILNIKTDMTEIVQMALARLISIRKIRVIKRGEIPYSLLGEVEFIISEEENIRLEKEEHSLLTLLQATKSVGYLNKFSWNLLNNKEAKSIANKWKKLIYKNLVKDGVISNKYNGLIILLTIINLVGFILAISLYGYIEARWFCFLAVVFFINAGYVFTFVNTRTEGGFVLYDNWYQARVSFLYDGNMKPLKSLIEDEGDIPLYALALDISKNKIQERFSLSNEEMKNLFLTL
ncbi:MAG: hypothetical protein ACRDA4_07425 [Filifactoraceae bacterium]